MISELHECTSIMSAINCFFIALAHARSRSNTKTAWALHMLCMNLYSPPISTAAI